MLVSEVAGNGVFPMLEKTLAFTESRNRMLAENIANIVTPGYRAKQLDVSAFQAALKEATAKRTEEGGELELPATREFRLDETGRLRVTPSVEPAENLLFQDGTNARIERQMAMLAENTMMNQTAVSLLRQYYQILADAIRGRTA
jgi:flagellar basal-body rod protein FlgB